MGTLNDKIKENLMSRRRVVQAAPQKPADTLDVKVEITKPDGITGISCSSTVRLSKNYNSFEGGFSASGDETCDPEELARWVRYNTMLQVSAVMKDMGVVL